MIINFDEINEVIIPNLNNGNGEVSAKMSINTNGKIMIARIPVGSSIGIHTHETSDDINYVISGIGKAVCDDKEEILEVGVCHYCPKGSSHSIINTGTEDLVLFTVVPEL
ncbi:cupin domain-containing protein [Clostridium cuniculi]|uniref:cupin domain-containing protein n=1 Tax=Clostridium cuniculi TaxID=2548455 RepID=UPI0018A8FDBD|nr:cupin domain-containing protein [Clostridium cuniculi]